MASDPILVSEVIRRLRDENPLSKESGEQGGLEVRLAVYDSPLATPRVIEIAAEDFDTFIGELAGQTYRVSQDRGGRIPFVVIREIVENLIHAHFRNAVITIQDNGNFIRVSDQGPGIQDKQRALQPGFTTATREMRRHIRGVGSGLPVAREQLAFLGGAVEIEDNLEKGTVVTLALSKEAGSVSAAGPVAPPVGRRDLTPRQKKVLLLIGELGAAGPTVIAKELDISHSTAYRELQALEAMGLTQSRGGGKRTLTEEGIGYLSGVFES